VAEQEELAGIGGWLAFFLLFIGVVAPLYLAYRVWSDLYADPAMAELVGDGWLVTQAIQLSVFAATIAVHFYIGWRLFTRRHWRSVRIAIAGLWVLSIGIPVAEAAAITAIYGSSWMGAIPPTAWWRMIYPMIIAAIGTAYLLGSRRVENTYPRAGKPEEELSEVFE
jgi:hypothetical protein